MECMQRCCPVRVFETYFDVKRPSGNMGLRSVRTWRLPSFVLRLLRREFLATRSTRDTADGSRRKIFSLPTHRAVDHRLGLLAAAKFTD